MKRIMITVLFSLFAIGTMAQQEIYDKYAYREDVLVAIANQLQVDSVTKIDAVMFRALNDNGWEWMIEEFRLETFVNQAMDESDLAEHFVTIPRDKAHLQNSAPLVEGKVDHSRSCLLVGDFKERTICIFFYTSRTQFNSLLHTKFNKPHEKEP